MSVNLWEALDRCESIRIRKTSAVLVGRGVAYACRTCRQVARHCRCDQDHKKLMEYESVAWAPVRRRVGETLEAMLWRGLAELSKRQIEGMPGPNAAERRRRDLRKLLLSADTQPC